MINIINYEWLCRSIENHENYRELLKIRLSEECEQPECGQSQCARRRGCSLDGAGWCCHNDVKVVRIWHQTTMYKYQQLEFLHLHFISSEAPSLMYQCKYSKGLSQERQRTQRDCGGVLLQATGWDLISYICILYLFVYLCLYLCLYLSLYLFLYLYLYLYLYLHSPHYMQP